MMNRRSLPVAVGAVLAGLGVNGLAHADVLVQYAFDTDLSSTSTATGASATDVARSPAYVDGSSDLKVTAVTATNVATGTAVGGTITTGQADDSVLQAHGPDDREAAITNGQYFTFTLEIADGYTADLDDFIMDFATGGSSGSGRGFTLEYSFDNFATSVSAGYTTDKDEDANQFSRAIFSLVNEDVVNEVTTSDVTFRIYPYAGGFNRSVRFDNITVTGTAVPEPASLALLGLGGLMMLRRRG